MPTLDDYARATLVLAHAWTNRDRDAGCGDVAEFAVWYLLLAATDPARAAAVRRLVLAVDLQRQHAEVN